jgi:hypothetical protein
MQKDKAMKTVMMAAFVFSILVSSAAALMGAGDTPKGTFCKVKDVCVIAQTEGDCTKIGGQAFETEQACMSGKPTPSQVPKESR